MCVNPRALTHTHPPRQGHQHDHHHAAVDDQDGDGQPQLHVGAYSVAKIVQSLRGRVHINSTLKYLEMQVVQR